MSNLSAPPHWSSFVDWGKQCDGITWGNAEKATPEGPNESVKYKSMREFPIDVKYSSGVYVKKMYKVDSERQKRDFARRKKEMEIQAEKEKRLSKGGMKPTPNKDKFEKIMKKNNIKKLETQASIILRDPIPDAMLKFLKESKMQLKSTNETVSNDIDHKTHVYTGSMSDLYELFQLQKKKSHVQRISWSLTSTQYIQAIQVVTCQKQHAKDMPSLGRQNRKWWSNCLREVFAS